MASNLLIPCGGKWVGMILQLRSAMQSVGALRGGRVLVADRAPLTPAGCFADASFVVPAVDHPDYVDHLLALCRAEGVRVVLPLIDIDLERLAPHADRFAEVGATLACPVEHLVDLCLDKARFALFAEKHDLAQPITYAPGELHDGLFPLFMKRRRGFGGIGAGPCRSLDEARWALEQCPDLLFQEHIRAPEVSVDAFISAAGGCTVRVPRLRDRVVGGEAMQSHTIRSTAVTDVADRTIAALSSVGLSGPVNIQIFLGDPPKLIEVNTRLGSASVLSNAATEGRLFASVLTEACGEFSQGDPDDYRELSLYRYLGDVFHDGRQPLHAVPPIGTPG